MKTFLKNAKGFIVGIFEFKAQDQLFTTLQSLHNQISKERGSDIVLLEFED